MVSSIRLALAGAVLAAGFAPAARAQVTELPNDWTLERKDGDCVLRTKWDDGTKFILGITADKTRIAVVNYPKWKWTAKEHYPTTFDVDGKGGYKAEAGAIDATTVAFTLPPDTGLWDAIKQGNSLNVEIAGAPVELTLEGSKLALTELDKCADSAK